MADERITVVGRLGHDPERKTTPKGEVVAFTVAHNARVQNSDGEWVNGATTWYDVNAWGRLGANAAASLRKGQPVVVHGVLKAREWTTQDGQTQRRTTLQAYAVGHDLNLGTAAFSQASGGRTSAPAAPQVLPQPGDPDPVPPVRAQEPAPLGWGTGFAVEEETPF